jgi:hypothetical protein
MKEAGALLGRTRYMGRRYYYAGRCASQPSVVPFWLARRAGYLPIRRKSQLSNNAAPAGGAGSCEPCLYAPATNFITSSNSMRMSNPHSRRHGISGNLAELNALLFVAHLSSRPAAQRWLRGRSEAHPIDNDNDAADEKRNCFGICGSSKPKSHIKPKHRENEARPKQNDDSPKQKPCCHVCLLSKRP